MSPVIGITCSTLIMPDMPCTLRCALPVNYVECARNAGGLPFVLPNSSTETADAYLGRIDGLVLSGGDDVDPALFGQEPRHRLVSVDARRDRFEMELARRAHAAGMPILAICRGIQVLNVALGGSMIQDIPAQVEGALLHAQAALEWDALWHEVAVEAGSRLHAIVGAERVRVNSFHHQAVGAPAPGLVVTARTEDGVIEGLEDPAHRYCVGVQWHPERRPEDPVTRGLFEALVESTRGTLGAR